MKTKRQIINEKIAKLNFVERNAFEQLLERKSKLWFIDCPIIILDLMIAFGLLMIISSIIIGFDLAIFRMTYLLMIKYSIYLILMSFILIILELSFRPLLLQKKKEELLLNR